MQNDHVIFGIHINNRSENATKVQQLLTDYGCSIKTRIGLHQVTENACSPSGLILLEMYGDIAPCNDLADKLNQLDGVEAQRMDFSH